MPDPQLPSPQLPDRQLPDPQPPDPQLPHRQPPDLHQTTPIGADRTSADPARPPNQNAADDAGAAEACFARGVALAGSGQTLQAAQQFHHANLLRPDHPATLTNLALLLSQLDQHETALACARRATDLQPGDPRAVLSLATVLYRQGNILASIPPHRQAVALAPDNPIAWTALGDCLVAVGRHDEAIASFRQALALDPEQLAARRSLAACGPPGAQAEDIAHLSALLARENLPTEDRITAGFALGQMLDTVGRFDDAFARFAAANALVLTTQAAAGHRFDAAAFDAAIDRLIAPGTQDETQDGTQDGTPGLGTQDFLARSTAWGNKSDLPVFIVGMPRSGSTLVEQIAASHSQVFAAGESRTLARRIEAMAKASAPRAPIDWDAAAARGLADRHVAELAALAAGAGTGVVRVLDKMLDNVFHLGLIAALFPNARVIICRRDPRDVCLSCYFRRFADPNLYTYDLLACARRAQAIDRLIAHWRSALPLRMHEVVHESLVAHPTEEIWRLIDFLGLEREAACLEAFRTDRVVTSTSAWQVRQPISAQSVGRWRPYRRHLSALLELLGDDD
jgi:tetratricopeptide (TPR) repeat protein